jgi:MFS family permease
MAGRTGTDGVGLRAILGVRGFRLIVGARLAGQLGDGLVQASLATFVLFSPERQPTAGAVALAFAILLLPYSLIGPFAGVFLDRWRRRSVLVYANLVRAALVVGLGVVVASGRDDWLLALWVLVTLGVNRFILAALSAGLPHVVADRYLVTGNAIAPTAGTIASVVGGVLGVGIRSVAGGGDQGSVVVLACAAGAYVLASGVAQRLRRDQLGPDEGATVESAADVVRGLVAGARHLAERRPAARAIGLVMVHRVMFGVATCLAVLQCRGLLFPDDTEKAIGALTLTIGAAGAGAFVGAVTTPKASKAVGIVVWQAAMLVLGGVMAAIGSSLGSLPGLLVAGFFIGLGGQAVKVASDTIVQEDVDDAARGRVFSLYDVAVNVSVVAGLTAAAFTAPLTGQSPVVSAWLAALAVVGAWWALSRERRDPASRWAADPQALPD